MSAMMVEMCGYWWRVVKEAATESWSSYERVSALIAVVLFLLGKVGLGLRFGAFDLGEFAMWPALGVLIGGALARFLFVPYRLQEEAVAAARAEAETAILKRQADSILLPHSVEDIVNMLDGHTEVQRDKLLSDYVGKWMRVTAPVADVSQRSPLFGGVPAWMVYLRPPQGVGCHLEFADGPWGGRVAVLGIGEMVTAKGRIRNAHGLSVSLVDCELEAVTPPVAIPAGPLVPRLDQGQPASTPASSSRPDVTTSGN